MARMLGRYQTPGCCPGTRAGWYRLRRAYGLDCSGADTNTRRAKRVEQQTFRRSLLPQGELDVPPHVRRDCRHGCDGECLLQDGPAECGLTCHEGLLADNDTRAYIAGRIQSVTTSD